MNPLSVEKCMAAYIRGVTGISGVVEVHESISADDIDLDASAIVAEAGDTTHATGNLYLVNVTVSLRSPATSIAQATHSTRWGLVSTALANQTNMATSFASTISTGNLGITFNGRYVKNLSVSTSDRSWVNSADVTVGVATV
jgi:hypothetical protein